MERTAKICRETKETDVTVELNLDGTGVCDIKTGIGFFDHMLGAFAFHAGFDLVVKCSGDLYVDGHHTAEDVGIVLGKAFDVALGDKRGIKRYGQARIPMDEALGCCVVDIGGRPFLVFKARFSDERIGDFSTCLTKEFMRAFVFNCGITMHISCEYGENDHHMTEAMFKAMAYAVKKAIRIGDHKIASTKGTLE